MDTYAFTAVFFIHLSMYAIEIIDINFYLRIKHYVNFQTFLTTKLVLSGFPFFNSSNNILIDFLSREQYTVIRFEFAIHGAIVSGIIFLSILTE